MSLGPGRHDLRPEIFAAAGIDIPSNSWRGVFPDEVEYVEAVTLRETRMEIVDGVSKVAFLEVCKKARADLGDLEDEMLARVSEIETRIVKACFEASGLSEKNMKRGQISSGAEQQKEEALTEDDEDEEKEESEPGDDGDDDDEEEYQDDGEDEEAEEFPISHVRTESDAVEATGYILDMSPTEARDVLKSRTGGSLTPSAVVAVMAKRGRRSKRETALPDEAIGHMLTYVVSNIFDPYPAAHEKEQLIVSTGLTPSKVKNWLTNIRKRHLAPLLRDGRPPRSQLEMDLLLVAKAAGITIGNWPVH